MHEGWIETTKKCHDLSSVNVYSVTFKYIFKQNNRLHSFLETWQELITFRDVSELSS